MTSTPPLLPTAAQPSHHPVRPTRAQRGKQLRAVAAFAVVSCAAAVATTLFASPAPAGPAPMSYRYNASDDSYVSPKYPTSNYGASGVLASGGPSDDGKTIYLKFIVHSLPAGSTNVSGVFTLNRVVTQLLPPTVGAWVVPDTSWTESTLTHQNRPALGASLGVITTTPGTGRVSWSVPVSGNGLVSVAVTSSTSATALYHSAEGAPEIPVFTVTYTPPSASPPPPPPVSGGKVWVGATCNSPASSISNFNTCNSAIGSLKFRRSFNSSLPATFATSAAKDDAKNGYHSFTSWKPPGGDYVGAANGKYDAAISAWARSVPRTGVYATTFHEPENDMTAAQFVAMQRHLYTVVKTANSTIQWGPVYMSYWWQPSRLNSIGGAAAWWVGSDRADFTAVDNYSTPTPIQLSKDPQFMSWYNSMITKGKPMLITEYGQYSIRPGSAPSPSMQALRAQTIAADASWIKSQGRISMWLYWNGTGAQGDWSLTDAASRQAWKNVAAAGRQS
ncbi:MAG: DNRLRE domain-containing protein [Mycobacteriales bacterium]